MSKLLRLALIVQFLLPAAVFAAADTTITFIVDPQYIGAVGSSSTYQTPVAYYINVSGLAPNASYDGLHMGFLAKKSTSTRGSKWTGTDWTSPSTLVSGFATTDANGSFSSWVYLRTPTNFVAAADSYQVRFRIEQTGTTSTITFDSLSPMNITSLNIDSGATGATAGSVVYGWLDTTGVLPPTLPGNVMIAYEAPGDTTVLSSWLVVKKTNWGPSDADSILYQTRMDTNYIKKGYFQLVVPANVSIGKLEVVNSTDSVVWSQTSTKWKSGDPGTLTDLGAQDTFLAMTPVLKQPGSVPSGFSLGQNYPNPFNPTTRIEYSVPQKSMVTLTVYNILGQAVATLYSGVRPSGNFVATFNADRFASGVYFYRLQASGFSQTKKMLLLK